MAQGRAAPSCSAPSPPRAWGGQLGTMGVSLGTEGDTWRCLGRSQGLAEHPWVPAEGQSIPLRPLVLPGYPCPAGGSCCLGVTVGRPEGHRHTPSLSSAGHLSPWMESRITPAPSSAPFPAEQLAHGERGMSPEEVSGSPTILLCFQEPPNISSPSFPCIAPGHPPSPARNPPCRLVYPH